MLALALFGGVQTNTSPAAEPISPTDGPINLLENGLDKFYTWSKDTQFEDPLNVYQIEDGVLQVTGEAWGGLTTKDSYANYHMVVEFKWGDRTWAHRKEASRDSGILVHAYGPDGGYSDTWPASIEAQIIEGGVGDFLAVPGKTPDGKSYPISITAEVEQDRDGESVWKLGGEKKTIGAGRINWFGRDPDWADTLGFRGTNDVESPHGEWTRLEIICDGEKIRLIVNGVVVNECFDVKPAAGKIVVQSEGAEIFVRKWELWPLGATPPPMSIVPKGFSVSVAAAAPLVTHPTMACFDDRGRLYVSDSGGVNGDPDVLESQLPGSIWILEDTDHDGQFDKRTLFADKLTLPQGALWSDGAVFVAAPPFIWRLEDTTGDDHADKREQLVGRFGYIGNAASIHGCFEGPTGRIYWCDGRHGHEFRSETGEITSQGKAARIFSCRPDGTDVRTHCGGGMDNPVEIDFTPEGEMIGTVNLMYGGPRGDCLTHWMHGGAYPRYDQGPIVDEFKRTGDLLTEVHNFGHVAVSGLTRYRSGTFGPTYRNSFFVTFFNSHKLVRVALERSGATYRARVEDFFALAGNDTHPTDVLEDADGSLLVIDTGGWFRIGCPNSQIAKPDILGSIYRIRREAAPPVDDPWGMLIKWNDATVDQLIALLGDDRFAVQQKAVRVLVGKGVGAVTQLSQSLSNPSLSPDIRQRLVWTLSRISSDSAVNEVRAALSDPDASVRQAAAFVSGLKKDTGAADQLRELLRIDSPPVRRQAATALGQIGDDAAIPDLLAALQGDIDRTLEHALIYALIEIANPAATADGLVSDSPAVRRGALIAIDQMDSARLTTNDVLPLLETNDFALRKSALQIVSKHDDWAGEMESVLRDLLSKPLNDELHGVVMGTIVAFGGNENVQELVASALHDAATDDGIRCLLLESISQFNPRPVPDAWIDAIGETLVSSTETVMRQAIATAADLECDAFLDALQAIARDAARPDALRVLAVAATPPRSVIDDEVFNLLIDQARADDSMNRVAAARAIGAAKLSPTQLIELTPVIAQAGPLELVPLLGAFEGVHDARIGDAIVKAIAVSPGRQNLSKRDIEAVFHALPGSLRETAIASIQDANTDTAEQVARIERLARMVSRGDAERGHRAFHGRSASCVLCHRVRDQGGRVGPDLTLVGQRRSARDLAEAILFPSASIARGFETVTVVTNTGQSRTGVIVRDTGSVLHLLTADQQEVRISHDEIEEIAPSAISVMPNGMDKILSDGDLIDIVAYLQSLK